jgi:hypothetical protein
MRATVGESDPRAHDQVSATYTMIPRSAHPFLGGLGCDHNKAPAARPITGRPQALALARAEP